MDIQEIKSSLCAYDARNPNVCIDYDTGKPFPKPKKNCSCDNCFYGRTRMAEYILKLIENKHTPKNERNENDN